MNSALMSYVLITPARNEDKFIEKTLQSVSAQTILPVKWVIVNDGSTDGTPEIVSKYAAMHKWIELVNLPVHRDRSFAGKVNAFNAGLERVRNAEYDIIGNLDADLSFDADYLEFLLQKFSEDRRLGVAGTVFREDGFSSANDSFEGQTHVAGGCQLFRRRCFEEIGGYVPNRAGGIDWIAVTTARMKGWKTQSFRERTFFHYRPLGTAERSVAASMFSYGEKDYYLGGHVLWELFRALYRATKRPYLIGGIAVLSGYVSAFCRRVERPVSKELIHFHRQEQMTKLKNIIKVIFTLKRLDNFEIEQSQ